MARGGRPRCPPGPRAQRRAGLSTIARRHGLDAQRLYKWRSRFSDEDRTCEEEAEHLSFAPVVVTGLGRTPAIVVRLGELEVEVHEPHNVDPSWLWRGAERRRGAVGADGGRLRADFLVLELLERGPPRYDFDELLGRGLAALHGSGEGPCPGSTVRLAPILERAGGLSLPSLRRRFNGRGARY